MMRLTSWNTLYLICSIVQRLCKWVCIQICICTHQPIYTTCIYSYSAIPGLTTLVYLQIQLARTKAVVLNWSRHQEGLLTYRLMRPHPRFSDSVGLGWDLSFCIFNNLSADAEAADLRTARLEYWDIPLLFLVLGHLFCCCCLNFANPTLWWSVFASCATCSCSDSWFVQQNLYHLNFLTLLSSVPVSYCKDLSITRR